MAPVWIVSTTCNIELLIIFQFSLFSYRAAVILKTVYNWNKNNSPS